MLAPTPRRWVSLQTRLTAMTAFLVLLAAGAVTYLFHRLSVESVERGRFLAASDVAESISLRLAAGRLPPRAILDSVLSEYIHANSEIVAASVLVRTEAGGSEILSSAGRSWDRTLEQEEAIATGAPVARIFEEGRERFWSVSLPIQGGKLPRGTSGAVGVWSTLQAVELLSRETRRLALIVLPISLASLVLLLSLVFRRVVQGPMESLRQAMIRAEAGDLRAEAPVARSDEIGFIARQYNQMLAQIRRTQEEREELLLRVQGFNEELAKTVGEATAELKERNQELSRLNEELYHLQRRLLSIERRSVAQQMTARLAHKIGTPLNLISGHVQILKRSRADDSELQEKLALVQSQIEKLTDTVQDILDETRASLRREPLDLDRILENIGALLRPTLAARGVELSLCLGIRATGALVEGVEDQIEQVFLTIMHNSLDAMPSGGHLTVTTVDAPECVRARIQDDGEGIPESVLPQIFRPFFTTKSEGRGTGLGLSIVQEILASHRATIRVESAVGKGTMFTIDFPRVPG
ncbi:MAG TPA: ATP-binding protein [Vicinamibacteria bacterium]|nr:ATP-binding protein [Vicinamibacteria bacterium]